MGIPYQAINCKRIILLTAILFICFAIVKQAFAYDSLFVVENVAVDITAANSVAAQEQAFEVAQVKAFRILARRMVDKSQLETIATPDSLTISSLIKDYEVTNEQLSSVRYVGTYIFRFREAAVSKLFSVSGVSFTNKSSKPLLILPILQIDGRNTIWSEGNIWMAAWSSANIPNSLVPIEVPIGDLMDISDIEETQALSYERRNLDRMLLRYNAKEAAIMIAIPDIILSQVKSNRSRATGNLRISIYRTDRAYAEHVRDVTIEADGKESVKKLYSRAVLRAHAVLQDDWKHKTVASAAQGQTFLVRTPIDNIGQWVRLQKSLGGISGLRGVNVISLRKDMARLSFDFRGDEMRLREALARSALYLGQGYQNGSAYKFTSNMRSEPNIIFDLTYGYKPANMGADSSAPQGSNSNIHTF